MEAVPRGTGAPAQISAEAEVLVWHLHGDGVELGQAPSGPLAALFAELGRAPRSLGELLAGISSIGDRPRLARMLEAVAADRRPRCCLHELRSPDGRALHLETRVFAELEQGRLVGATRTIERELQLEREHEELAAASEALALTVLTYDRRLRLLHRVGTRDFPADRAARPPWFAAQLRAALREGLQLGGGEVQLPGREARTYEVRFTPQGAPPGGITALVSDVTERTRVAKELADHESELFTLLDTVADAIGVQAPDGRLLFINRSGRKQLGLDAVGSLLGDQDQASFFRQWEVFDEAGARVPLRELPGTQALAGQPEPDRLLRYRRKGTTEDRWALVRAVPLVGEGGQVRMAINAWTDVTEIQRARVQLRQQQAVLAAESEASLDAILVVANDGRVLDYNSRFLDVWRLHELRESRSDSELLAAAASRVADPEAFRKRVDEIYADAQSTSHDELLLKDGRVLERYSAPAISEGVDVGRVWFFRDVTDRKRAEQRDRLLIEERAARAASERAQRRWEFLAQLSRGLAGLLEHDAIVQHVARTCVPRLGLCCIVDKLEEDGQIRRTWLQLPSARTAAEVPALARGGVDPLAPRGAAAALRERRSWIELVDATSPGTDAWSPLGEPGSEAASELRSLGVKWVVSVPLALRDKPTGVLSFGRAEATAGERADLLLLEEVAQRTALALESARLYQNAQDAIAGRDDFLSVASHELRTPLTALRLVHQSLSRVLERTGKAADPAVARLVATADAQEHRLGKLIDSLLDVTRVQGNKLQLDLADVDLSDVARTTAALFRDELARLNQVLTVEASQPVVGRWDRARLEQVATNLLSNAIKYGNGQPIELTVWRDGERAKLKVRDHGIGIPQHHQSRVFERFERAVSSRHYGGLGLGLYIVNGIVQSLGGTVCVESEPGQGATFTVDLPLRRESPP